MNKKSKSGSSRKRRNNTKEKLMSSKASLILKYKRSKDSDKIDTSYITIDKTLKEEVISFKNTYLKAAYKHLMTKERKNIEKLEWILEAFRKHEMYDEAISIVQQLIKLSSNRPSYYIALGRLYISRAMVLENTSIKITTNDFKEAVSALENAKELDPENLSIYPYISIAYAGIRDWDKVSKYLKFRENLSEIKDETERNDLDNDFNYAGILVLNRYYRLEGVSSMKRGDYPDAIIYLQKAIEIYYEDFYSLFFLGLAYEKMNKNSESIDAFLKCIELNPDVLDSYYMIGRILYLNKDYENCAHYMGELLRITEFKKIKSRNVEKHNLINEAKVYFYYCLGMYNWGKGFLNQAKTFIKKAQYNSNKYDIGFEEPLYAITEIINTDKEFEMLHLSTDFVELLNRSALILADLQNLCNKLETKENGKNTKVTALVLVKKYVALNLLLSLYSHYQSLHRGKIDKERIKIVTSESSLNVFKKFMKTLNFEQGVQSIEGVQNFVKKIKMYKNPFNLSVSKQKNIIKELKSHLQGLGKQISINIYSQHVKSIALEDIDALLQKHAKPLAELVANLSIRKLKEEFEIKIPPENLTLKIGIDHKPYAIISGTRYEPSDKVFLYLTLLAVVKRKVKNEAIEKFEDLDLSHGEQDISLIRKYLLPIVKNEYKKDAKSTEVVQVLSAKKVGLGFFEKENITIDHSIKYFKWRMGRNFERKIKPIKNIIDKKNKLNEEIEKEEIEGLIIKHFKKIKTFQRTKDTYFKIYNLAEKACKIMCWRFQTAQFRKELKQTREICEQISKILKRIE